MSESELIDVNAACRHIGGKDTPIAPSTLYRGIASGYYPKGIRVSRGKVRWRRSELDAALEKLASARSSA